MQRDNLDFKNMPVGKLFIKQFFPTLLGMVSSALFVIVDGIFVGRGIGSDALAAVNIVAPLYMLAAGIGLMLGMGGGIVTSINLSRGKRRVANINFSQAIFATVIIFALLTGIILLYPYQTASLMGAGPDVREMAVDYLFWFTLFLLPLGFSLCLPFFIRLGSPQYAMWCMLLATAINLVLDYIFIFPLGWGLMGAALATGIGESVGALLLLGWFFRKESPVVFERIKLSSKSIRLSLRNIWYMIKLGFSSFLSEATIAVMTITGNLIFASYLGTDGIAAYSIVCYLFPIIFMVFNATVQSAQPIISYNYGCGQLKRARKALRMALAVAATIALSMFMINLFFSGNIVSLFVPDTTSLPWFYAVQGLPLFAVDYLFFAINIVVIGYYTSIERIRRALLITTLRGVLPVLFFYLLPLWFSTPGIWLSVAAGDIITTIFVLLLLLKDKLSKHGMAHPTH